MKKQFLLLAALALFLSIESTAQKTLYFNDRYERIKPGDEYDFREELSDLPKGWTYVKRFSSKDHLQQEGAYSVYKPYDKKWKQEGLHKYYRPDTSVLYYTEQYESGKLQGELRSYYPNGALKRIERYEKGEFTGGECFNEDGSARAFTRFQQVPEYPGGQDAMMRFLEDSLQYPDAAFDGGYEGKVIVSFVVDKEGNVTDVRLLKDIGGGCGAEAMRIVKAMPRWQSGLVDDVPVWVRYSLPLTFKLKMALRKKNRKDYQQKRKD